MLYVDTKFKKLKRQVTLTVFAIVFVLFSSNSANAQSLTTNPVGSYEAASSGASVNVGATVTVGTGSTTLTAATIDIAGNYSSGDVLKINNSTSGTDSGLSFSFNSETGTMNISGIANEATYQTVLRKVTFNTTSTNTSLRTITFSLNAAVPYSGNGHYYEFINDPVNWFTAVTNAAGRTYFGLQGYLVTVTSSGESDFVKGKLAGAQGWLGASDAANEGEWKWVTGPEGAANGGNGTLLVYTNWNDGEPNDANGEDYGQFVTSGMWNDLNGTSGLGYVVEYGGSSGDPAVQISDDVTVVVVTNPTGVSATETTICQGESTTLTAQGTQGTVHWYTGSCGGSQVGTGNTIAVYPLQTTTYYARNEVDGTYSTGCASITITVNPLLQYRSKQSGDWRVAGNWEQFNGTSWVTATSYPGEISNECGSPIVTVQSTHTMTLYSGSISIPNLSIETDGLVRKNTIATLEIVDQLIMKEDADGGIQVVSIEL
nr:lectin-like protein [uncultured Draconibacterium sp.]